MLFKEDKFINLLECENVFIDCSTMNGDIVTTVKVNMDNQGSTHLNTYLVVNCEDGFKLKDELPVFKFLAPQTKQGSSVDENEITVKDIDMNALEYTVCELENVEDNIYYDDRDYLLRNFNLKEIKVSKIDKFNSIGYCINEGNTSIAIILFNNWNRVDKYNPYITIDGVGYNLSTFNYPCRNDYFEIDVYVDLVADFKFKVGGGGTPPIENIDTLFNTYYTDNVGLEKIRKTDLTNDVVINTYSVPIIFDETGLEDVEISIGGNKIDVVAKKFKSNLTTFKLFEYSIPMDLLAIECCFRLPFNLDVKIDYSLIEGCVVIGVIEFEVLTNTSTLVIYSNGDIVYKDIFNMVIEVPFNLDKNYKSYKSPFFRLCYENPKCLIVYNEKVKGITESKNYIKGTLVSSFENMLKQEYDILKSLIREGVYYNE